MEGLRADPRTVSVAWDLARENCAVGSATIPRCSAFLSWNLSPPFGGLMACGSTVAALPRELSAVSLNPASLDLWLQIGYL